jgi:hypothetical protein
MPVNEVYLGDYVETAIIFAQRLLDKAVADDAIDKKDQTCTTMNGEKPTRLSPIDCPDISLNKATLRTKIPFHPETVAKLMANPNENLSGLQESPVTRRIMGPLINFGMAALSMNKKVMVDDKSTVWGPWGAPRFECSVEEPHDKGPGNKDIVFKDNTEPFAAMEMKSPKMGVVPRWSTAVEMKRNRDVRVAGFYQVRY